MPQDPIVLGIWMLGFWCAGFVTGRLLRMKQEQDKFLADLDNKETPDHE